MRQHIIDWLTVCLLIALAIVPASAQQNSGDAVYIFAGDWFRFDMHTRTLELSDDIPASDQSLWQAAQADCDGVVQNLDTGALALTCPSTDGQESQLVRADGERGAWDQTHWRSLLGKDAALGPFDWSRQTLAYVERYSSEGRGRPTGGYGALVNIITPSASELVTVLQTRPSILQLAWSPDGTQLAIVSLFGAGSYLHIYDAAHHRLLRNSSGWVADGRSVSIRDMAWLPDSDKLTFLYFDHPDAYLAIFDVTSRTFEYIRLVHPLLDAANVSNLSVPFRDMEQ